MSHITSIGMPLHGYVPKNNSKTESLIANKDTNADGVLSAKELDMHKEVFDKIDVNGDGQANKEELAQLYHPKNLVNRQTTNVINAKDTNGDGVLSAEELDVPEEVFNKIDVNGDGQADRNELNAHLRSSQTSHMTTHLINTKDTDGDVQTT